MEGNEGALDFKVGLNATLIDKVSTITGEHYAINLCNTILFIVLNCTVLYNNCLMFKM